MANPDQPTSRHTPTALLVSFAHFELDQARFELRRQGERLPVQPKVLDLLLYLVRHHDRVISKDELLDNVWLGINVSEASLSQAVCLARKLLGDAADAQNFIRTVRGRGFQFTAPLVTIATPGPIAAGTAVRFPDAQTFGVTSVSQAIDDSTATEAGRAGPAPRPHLFIAFHCDDVGLGGARCDLGEIDEVEIGRGPTRTIKREAAGITRRLDIRIPGEAVSRRHAQLLRVHRSFCVVDESSKNGTFVNGQRVIDRRVLEDGDFIECGRTCFLYHEALATPPDLRPDLESASFLDELDSLAPGHQPLRAVVQRISRTNLPILLSGAGGLDQERAARSFHRRSERTGPFVMLAAVAGQERTEVEAAARNAAGGTLFIDQVETLSQGGQAALLAAIDEGEARIICAGSVDLEAREAAGTFRGDLARRLGAVRHVVAPLRERRGDLGFLIGRLLARAPLPPRFSTAAARALLRHDWPGNLCELEPTLAAATALAGGEALSPAHLPAAVAAAAGD